LRGNWPIVRGSVRATYRLAKDFVVEEAGRRYVIDHDRVALNVKNFANKRYFVPANGAGDFVGEGLGAYLTIKHHQ